MKNTLALCCDCGNQRSLIASMCPFCGSKETYVEADARWKCHVINLEMNMPLVDQAMERFHVQLEKIRGKGLRAVKVIHGHGSSGSGGNIRREFRRAMEDGLWGEGIMEVYFGEILNPNSPQYQSLLQTYPAIKNSITKDMQGNPGITLLIIDKNF
ncbi:MAG: hypothetical protein WCK68_10420 [Betaproteobacteria bacterium]|jgi:hypothetical protein